MTIVTLKRTRRAMRRTTRTGTMVLTSSWRGPGRLLGPIYAGVFSEASEQVGR